MVTAPRFNFSHDFFLLLFLLFSFLFSLHSEIPDTQFTAWPSLSISILYSLKIYSHTGLAFSLGRQLWMANYFLESSFSLSLSLLYCLTHWVVSSLLIKQWEKKVFQISLHTNQERRSTCGWSTNSTWSFLRCQWSEEDRTLIGKHINTLVFLTVAQGIDLYNFLIIIIMLFN